MRRAEARPTNVREGVGRHRPHPARRVPRLPFGPALAKKKTRTPPPPRRVQAPARRSPVSAETERRTKFVLYGVAALGFSGLAAAIALFTASGSGGEPKSAANVIREAGC